MGVNHTKDIFETSMDWATPTHKLTALVMAHAADRRGIIRLNQQEIGSEVGVSRQRVSMIVDDLCDMEVIKRLGHGRYGLRYGLPKEEVDSQMLPARKGALKEQERLRAILKEERENGLHIHGIAWKKDGWPVLVDMDKLQGEENGTE